MATLRGLHRVLQVLDADGVVAYPTEAVWGLGCDPWSAAAVGHILALKQRQAAKGLILIGSEFAQLLPFMATLNKAQQRKLKQFWPGPVTWVVPAAHGVPDWLTGGRDSIAVRWTAHPVANALCQAWGGALVSTSANRHGHRPARSEVRARSVFGAGVGAYLSGSTGGQAAPSRIINLITGEQIR